MKKTSEGYKKSNHRFGFTLLLLLFFSSFLSRRLFLDFEFLFDDRVFEFRFAFLFFPFNFFDFEFFFDDRVFEFRFAFLFFPFNFCLCFLLFLLNKVDFFFYFSFYELMVIICLDFYHKNKFHECFELQWSSNHLHNIDKIPGLPNGLSLHVDYSPVSF